MNSESKILYKYVLVSAIILLLIACGMTLFLKGRGVDLIENRVSENPSQINSDRLFLAGIKDFEIALNLYFQDGNLDLKEKSTALALLKSAEENLLKSTGINGQSAACKKALAHISAVNSAIITGKKSDPKTEKYLQEYRQAKRQIK